MRIRKIDEPHLLGGALVLLGLSLGGAAGVAGLLAFDHMSLTAAMCGPAPGHCLRCVAVGALLAAALVVSAAGAWLLKPRAAAQRAD